MERKDVIKERLVEIQNEIDVLVNEMKEIDDKIEVLDIEMEDLKDELDDLLNAVVDDSTEEEDLFCPDCGEEIDNCICTVPVFNEDALKDDLIGGKDETK